MCSVQIDYVIEVNTPFNVKHVMNELDLAMSQVNVHDWYSRINQYGAPSGNCRNKLWSYILFKHEFSTEPYVMMTMSRSNRSGLARFKCVMALISIENGRYKLNPVLAEIFI